MSKNSISECVKAAKLLDDINRKRFPPIPDGWFTAEEYMEEAGFGRESARRHINILTKGGKLKKQSWMCMDVCGRACFKSIYKTK